MTLNFQNKIDIEQLRAIEESGGSLIARVEGTHHGDFEAWLKARTVSLKQQPSVQSALQYAPTLYHRILFSLALLLFIAGIITTNNLLANTNNTLNIFWVLGALLGVNALSLCVWLVLAMTANHNAGLIAPLLHSLMRKLSALTDIHSPSITLRHNAHHKNESINVVASRTWFRLQQNPHFQTWHLGRLTHWAWCCYLIGTVLGLIMVFATRQFDFIWESTLLGADTFVHLHHWLSAPLQALGLPTPSSTDMIQSNLNALVTNTSFENTRSELRQQWAWFLIGCLIVYAVVPRMLAGFICLAFERRGRQRWRLDLSLPYFRQLQQQYGPSTSASIVIDPDHHAAAMRSTLTNISERSVPANAYWLGIELNPQIPWTGFQSPAYLGQVTDQQSLQTLCARIAEMTDSIVIAVDANNAPDRGLQRTLRELILCCREPWLALLITDEVSDSKWQNWLVVAHSLGLTENRITRITLK